MGRIATHLLHPQEQDPCSGIQAQEGGVDPEAAVAEVLES
jgi:hypothetical protein